jgi:hypothetical protein
VVAVAEPDPEIGLPGLRTAGALVAEPPLGDRRRVVQFRRGGKSDPVARMKGEEMGGVAVMEIDFLVLL